MVRLELLQSINGHKGIVWNVSWHPQGKIFASCGEDKIIKLWSEDGQDWTVKTVLVDGHQRTIREVAWSPCGNFLASASFDATTAIWDKKSGQFECNATLEGHENEVKSVAWSPSGHLLATCGRDKSVWIWEVAGEDEYECEAVLNAHNQDVKKVAWHPSLDILASASYDNSIKLYKEDSLDNDWSCIATLQSHESTVWSLAFDKTVLENFAPKKLSESWDNTGLLVQPYSPRPITKILLTNDLTEKVALEAQKHECEMIISYHPPIFAPLKSVVQSSWKERVVSFLLENRISLYSPHTSWDSVQGGVNDWLASCFPYIEVSPIVPGIDPNTGAGRFLKLEPGMTLSDAVSRVKKLTDLKHVRLGLANGKSLSDTIETVALCAGSGGSVLKSVVNCDLFLTGEMLHHDVLDAAQRGISVILTNHSDSERGFLRGFSTNLQNKLNNQIQVLVSEFDKDPLMTV
ncbi:unnamed protein product, partial [Iphiclides podalirius]